VDSKLGILLGVSALSRVGVGGVVQWQHQCVLDPKEACHCLLNVIVHLFGPFASSDKLGIATIEVAAALEITESIAENVSCKLNPTDYGFDPLNLAGKTDEQKQFMQEAELFDGRIVGFAAQEFLLLTRFLSSSSHSMLHLNN